MNDKQYTAFLILLMCSDPWPIMREEKSEYELKSFANEEAKKRGFTDWIDAYHQLLSPQTISVQP